MAAIANDGIAVKPHVVHSVLSSTGTVISTTQTQVLGQVMSAQAVKDEQDILREVIESGTGTAAAIDGADVMGKTGTAETNNAASDAWFIGTAQKDGKSVTVAIVVEKGDNGGEVAAPKAGAILEAALDAL